jgi:hypothetical protein
MDVVTETTIAVPAKNTAKLSADGMSMTLSTEGADTSISGPYIVRYYSCFDEPNYVADTPNHLSKNIGTFGFNIVFKNQ